MIHHFLKGISIFILVMVWSCELDPCKDYVCVNGKAQEDFNECICICNAGWDGQNCTIEDKCVTGNVYCVPGQGNCNMNTGKCSCFSGYEGDSCQIYSRDKFLVNDDSSLWIAVDTCKLCETCIPVIYIYDPIMMKAGSGNKTLDIYNIRDLDETIFVTVNVNGRTFSQKSSYVDFGNIRISNVEGTLSDDNTTIHVSYVSSEASSSNCSGQWTKQ